MSMACLPVRYAALLAGLVLVPQGGADAQNVPKRTLTFDSYYSDPHFRRITPVYVSEVDVVSVIPDTIVDVHNRATLDLGDGCTLRSVAYRRRQSGTTWGALPAPGNASLFRLNDQNGQVAIQIDLTALKGLYEPLGATGTRNMHTEKGTGGRKGQRRELFPFPELHVEERRALMKAQAARHKAEAAQRELEEAERDQHAARLLRRLQVEDPEVVGQGMSYDQVTEHFSHNSAVRVSGDFIYDFALLLHCPGRAENGRNGYERLDLTLVPRVRRGRATSAFCKPGSDKVSPGLRAGMPFGIARPHGGEELPGPEYFMCEKPHHVERLRRRLQSEGLLEGMLQGGEDVCMRGSTGLSIKRALGLHQGRQEPTLSCEEFDCLHPEEAWWLDFRLDNTALAISDCIGQQLGKEVSPELARLKVAVAHGGEGKRGALNSLGVSSALYDLGIYEHASWVSGSSGAAWHLASWYAASHEQNKLVPPSELFEKLSKALTRAAVGEDFDGNEVLTDFFKGYRPIYTDKDATQRRARGRSTDRILCDSELRLNAYHSLEGVQGLPSFSEYVTRAMSTQFLDPISPHAIAIKLSDLVKATFLTRALGPLPVFQVQEGSGVGSVWEVTPYDTTLDKADLHLSFPTQQLGAKAGQGGEWNVTTHFMDTLAFLAGLSGNVLPSLRGQPWADVVCKDSKDENCGPFRLRNPFRDLQPAAESDVDPTLSERDVVSLSGDGPAQSLPIWPFITPTRVADVVFAVDASSGRRTPSPDEVLQEQSSMALALAQALDGEEAEAEEPSLECVMDSTRKQGGVTCPDGPEGVFYPHTKCCDYCHGPEGAENGCWPSDTPDRGLFYMPKYGQRSNHTLPPLPQRREDIEPLLGKVTFFGCDSLQRTSIVYLPNRLVISGAGGGPSLKSIIDYQIPMTRHTGYTDDSVACAYLNGAKQIPTSNDRFKYCLACLYTAKATRNEGTGAFSMKRDCADCYDEFCYKKPPVQTGLAKRTRRIQEKPQV